MSICNWKKVRPAHFGNWIHKSSHKFVNHMDAKDANHKNICYSYLKINLLMACQKRVFSRHKVIVFCNFTISQQSLKFFSSIIFYPADDFDEIWDEAWYFTLHQYVISLDHIFIFCFRGVNLIDGYFLGMKNTQKDYVKLLKTTKRCRAQLYNERGAMCRLFSCIIKPIITSCCSVVDKLISLRVLPTVDWH